MKKLAEDLLLDLLRAHPTPTEVVRKALKAKYVDFYIEYEDRVVIVIDPRKPEPQDSIVDFNP